MAQKVGRGIAVLFHDRAELEGGEWSAARPDPLCILLTHLLTYLLTYLLTPWCRVLLEKLTGLQLVKKFPAFHGTRRFITALTSVRHLSLSWASPIQSIYPHSTLLLLLNLVEDFLVISNLKDTRMSELFAVVPVQRTKPQLQLASDFRGVTDVLLSWNF